jgi:hypothetical protein
VKRLRERDDTFRQSKLKSFFTSKSGDIEDLGSQSASQADLISPLRKRYAVVRKKLKVSEEKVLLLSPFLLFWFFAFLLIYCRLRYRLFLPLSPSKMAWSVLYSSHVFFFFDLCVQISCLHLFPFFCSSQTTTDNLDVKETSTEAKDGEETQPPEGDATDTAMTDALDEKKSGDSGEKKKTATISDDVQVIEVKEKKHTEKDEKEKEVAPDPKGISLSSFLCFPLFTLRLLFVCLLSIFVCSRFRWLAELPKEAMARDSTETQTHQAA